MRSLFLGADPVEVGTWLQCRSPPSARCVAAPTRSASSVPSPLYTPFLAEAFLGRAAVLVFAIGDWRVFGAVCPCEASAGGRRILGRAAVVCGFEIGDWRTIFEGLFPSANDTAGGRIRMREGVALMGMLSLEGAGREGGRRMRRLRPGGRARTGSRRGC